MPKQIRTTGLLIAALGIALPSLASAWTPYGYGPYGPDYQPGYPVTTAPAPQAGARAYEPPPPASADPRGGYGPTEYPYGAAARSHPYLDRPPPPRYLRFPDYGPQPGQASGFPGAVERGFGAPSGFRLSREASDDAYSLTIELDGTSPEEVQVRPQGRWIVISREHTEQQVQKDSFGDGRGFTRSFSYSSGTANRRLSVPRDGDLSAMSREDGDGTIRIRIPRKGH